MLSPSLLETVFPKCACAPFSVPEKPFFLFVFRKSSAPPSPKRLVSTIISSINHSLKIVIYALTLDGFDDQERNLIFAKTDFQLVLKLKFHTCLKLAFYPLDKQNITRV